MVAVGERTPDVDVSDLNKTLRADIAAWQIDERFGREGWSVCSQTKLKLRVCEHVIARRATLKPRELAKLYPVLSIPEDHHPSERRNAPEQKNGSI